MCVVHSSAPRRHVHRREGAAFLRKMVSASLLHRDLPEKTRESAKVRVQDCPWREDRRGLGVAGECAEGAEDFEVGHFSHEEGGCGVGRLGLPHAQLVTFYQDAAGVEVEVPVCGVWDEHFAVAENEGCCEDFDEGGGFVVGLV